MIKCFVIDISISIFLYLQSATLQTYPQAQAHSKNTIAHFSISLSRLDTTQKAEGDFLLS